MIKLLFVFLLGYFFSHNAFSQDIMVLKNGDEVKVKVAEVLQDIIKYKKWENQDGPLYSEPKSNVFMIKYQNGTKDVFSNTVSNNSPIQTGTNEDVQKGAAISKLETYVTGKYQKENILKLVAFKKIDGALRSYVGQTIYEVKCALTLHFLADCWLYGNVFEGYWNNGIYWKEPDLKSSGFQMMYTIKKIPSGTKLILNCTATMPKTDNGFNVEEFTIDSETNLGVQSVTTPPVISSISEYNGQLITETLKANISFVFKSIEDEAANQPLLKNMFLNVINTNKRFIKNNSTSASPNPTDLRNFQIDIELKTFYTPKQRANQTGYTAELRLVMFLWELNSQGQKIKGTPSKNILIKEYLGAAYATKQKAVEALANYIDNNFNYRLLSFFPITTEIAEIIDANNKGEPKKVKISCGLNQGTFKNMKFDIIDSQRKTEDFDLDVTEVFDDYSICKVKNNESLISDAFKANRKIKIVTSYSLN
jgi:hypothetical protein